VSTKNSLFSGALYAVHMTCYRLTFLIRRHLLFKVIEFGANRELVYDFLLDFLRSIAADCVQNERCCKNTLI